MRPVVSSGSSGTTRTGVPRERPERERSGAAGGRESRRGRGAGRADGRRGAGDRAGVRVRRLARGVDDGFSSSLVVGLRSSEDADRLAQEMAFAARRLQIMESEPSGLWGEVAAGPDIEERTWLAFLIAFIGIHEGPEPFGAIGSARVGWDAFSAGEELPLEGIERGPRGAFEPQRAGATLDAYRAWATRAGSQRAAFIGEESWTPERRFDRLFERLALPGMHRDARFELLVSLSRLGVYELRAGKLHLSGENEATWAAKRAFGIGDQMLLERRAADLADACGAPLDALDLALHNWGGGERLGAGIDPELEGDPVVLSDARAALGL